MLAKIYEPPVKIDLVFCYFRQCGNFRPNEYNVIEPNCVQSLDFAGLRRADAVEHARADRL